MGFLTKKLRARIEANCHRNKVAELATGFVLDWADTATDEMSRAVLENVEAGLMEIGGWEDQGALVRLTPAGRRYAESLSGQLTWLDHPQKRFPPESSGVCPACASEKRRVLPLSSKSGQSVAGT